MSTLRKAPDFPRGSAGSALPERDQSVPFPYVVLSGRDALEDVAEKDASFPTSEDERAWFVAYAELGAPRWSNARETLVRSLAISDSDLAQSKAAQGERTLTTPALRGGPPSRSEPMVPVSPVEGAPTVKLRAKRRAPSLNTNPPMPVLLPRVDSDDPSGAGLPMLAEGPAPLMPIPGFERVISPGASRGFEDVVVITRAAKPAQPPSGRLEKVLGMTLLCTLCGVALVLLIQDFMPSRGHASDSISLVAAEVASAAASMPEAPLVTVTTMPEGSSSSVPVGGEIEPDASVAPAAPAGPVQASPAFTNYVSQMRVSGVSLGKSPRALINGRMVHVGDMVDPVLEVRLVLVDGASRQLVFEDGSTARIQARY